MLDSIKLVKLVSGETVIGKLDAMGEQLAEVALLQSMPSQQGVQMMLMPYGYPFETTLTGVIDMKHVVYTYSKVPEELAQQYLQATSNITIPTTKDMQNLSKLSLVGANGK